MQIEINESMISYETIEYDQTLQSAQQLAYRQGVESAMGSDENLYRMEWVSAAAHLLH